MKEQTMTGWVLCRKSTDGKLFFVDGINTSTYTLNVMNARFYTSRAQARSYKIEKKEIPTKVSFTIKVG